MPLHHKTLCAWREKKGERERHRCVSERERRFVRNGGTRRLGGSRGHGAGGGEEGGGGGKGRACPPQRGAGERSVARARGSCCRWGAGGVTRSRKGAKHEGNERDPSPRVPSKGMGDLLYRMWSTRLTSHEPMVLYVPEPWPAGTAESALLHGSPVPDSHGPFASSLQYV